MLVNFALHTQEPIQHKPFDGGYFVAKLTLISVLANVIFRFAVHGHLFHSCLVLCEVVMVYSELTHLTRVLF